jgi:hypothetical protein
MNGHLLQINHSVSSLLSFFASFRMTSKIKRAQRPDRKPGRELASVQKVFSVLIFCYFFIKKKVVAPAAMSGTEHLG